MVEAASTLGELLRDGAATLRAAGLDEPRREAQRIWAGLVRAPLSAVVLAGDAAVPEGDRVRFVEALNRRAGGEPLAYVTGWTGFRHLDLRCDARALIPRPETELLVGLALERCGEGEVADVGTGTGAIALALRQEGRYRTVVGTDLSPAALALAGENGDRLGLSVEWLCGDLLAPIAGRRFDLLVSNPPYLTEAEWSALDSGVRDFEPKSALASGEEGLDATARLLRGAGAILRPGGWLLLELDERRSGRTAELAGDCGWSAVEVVKDLFDRPRYLVSRWEHAE